MMKPISIRIIEKNLSNEPAGDDDGFDMELSDFGGLVPNVGDQIVSPYIAKRDATANDWINPQLRSVWTVKERYFKPNGGTPYVALIVCSRPAQDADRHLLA